MMSRGREEILANLPHRDPFLWLDEIVERGENLLVCRKTFTGNEDFFRGHFPSFPVVPGVILCEIAFQTAALLVAVSSASKSGGPNPTSAERLPVVTRLREVQFREMVRPGQTVEALVRLEDHAAGAYRFHATLRADGKLVARMDFACMVINPPRGPAAISSGTEHE